MRSGSPPVSTERTAAARYKVDAYAAELGDARGWGVAFEGCESDLTSPECRQNLLIAGGATNVLPFRVRARLGLKTFREAHATGCSHSSSGEGARITLAAAPRSANSDTAMGTLREADLPFSAQSRAAPGRVDVAAVASRPP